MDKVDISLPIKHKVILHFDGRNTIFIADRMSRISVEEALNTHISGLIWGFVKKQEEISFFKSQQRQLSNGCKHKYINGTHGTYQVDPSNAFIIRNPPSSAGGLRNAKDNVFENLLPPGWSQCPESPCLRSPQPNAESIYKILERQIVRTPDDRRKLRRRLGMFTRTPEGQAFRDLFERHIAAFRLIPKTVPISQEAKTKLIVEGRDGEQYHYLIPAFLKLITWLINNQIRHAIVIRSHGQDIPFVLEAVNAFLNGLHPTEEAPHKVPLAYKKRPREATMHRWKDDFIYTMSDGSVLREPKEIYASWSNEEGIIGVKDDFEYWLENNFHYTASKPMWYNPDDLEVQHIFLDDNLRIEPDEINVVDYKLLNEQRRLNLNELEDLEGVICAQPDLLAMMLDPDYYIKLIVSCIKRWRNLKNL